MCDYENFDYCSDFNNRDYLFILKKDKPVSDEEFFDKELKWQWESYNHKTREWEIQSYGDFSFSDWDQKLLLFDNEHFRELLRPKERLMYAYASLHDDSQINAILRKHFPTIQEFHIPPLRGTKKTYLKYWMEKYNFTLEDFIFNDKYLVISDSYDFLVTKMTNLGFFDEENIEHCSGWGD